MPLPLCITIMAKAPQPGRVKTRLIPALGEQGAARLAQKLLCHTAATAAEAAQQLSAAQVQLCVAPQPQSLAWQPLRRQWQQSYPQLHWTAQTGGDLGARMQHAVQRNARNGRATILIGMDCPELRTEHLLQAAAALRTHDAVIAPCADGGYALLALQHPRADIFTDMPWSSERVAALTLCRLHAAGAQVCRLQTLHDVDTAQDLCRLPPQLLK